MTFLMVLLRPAETCRMAQTSAEKRLNTLGLPKSSVLPQRQKESSCQGPQRIFGKKKVYKVLRSDHGIVRSERVKTGKSRTLARQRRARAREYRSGSELHVKERWV